MYHTHPLSLDRMNISNTPFLWYRQRGFADTVYTAHISLCNICTPSSSSRYIGDITNSVCWSCIISRIEPKRRSFPTRCARKRVGSRIYMDLSLFLYIMVGQPTHKTRSFILTFGLYVSQDVYSLVLCSFWFLWWTRPQTTKHTFWNTSGTNVLIYWIDVYTDDHVCSCL